MLGMGLCVLMFSEEEGARSNVDTCEGKGVGAALKHPAGDHMLA